MKEGISKKNEPLEVLAKKAEEELTPEQLETLDILFPEGVSISDREQLLRNRLIVEMTTNPNMNLREVRDAFMKERNEIEAKGGLDPMEYVIENGGVVSSLHSDEENPTVH